MPVIALEDSVLKESDVNFTWHSKTLLRILQYASKIGNNKVALRFYKDRISILQVEDDVVMSEVEIYREALLTYDPGELTEGHHKLAIVNLGKDVLSEYKRFYAKDGYTTVNIDTKYNNVIEFVFQNVKVWTTIEHYESQKEKIDRVPNTISQVRADKNIPFAHVVIENKDFKLMCKTSKKDINKRLRITVENENCLNIKTSGDSNKGISITINVAGGSKKDPKQVYFDIDNMNDLESLYDFMLYYNREVDTKKLGKLGYAKKITTKTSQSATAVIKYLSFFNIDLDGDTIMEIRKNEPIVLERSFSGIHMLMIIAQSKDSELRLQETEQQDAESKPRQIEFEEGIKVEL